MIEGAKLVPVGRKEMLVLLQKVWLSATAVTIKTRSIGNPPLYHVQPLDAIKYALSTWHDLLTLQ
jgi:hypothetical protein